MDVVYNVTFSCLFHWIILNRSKVTNQKSKAYPADCFLSDPLVLFQAPFNSPSLNILT
jgi:hypothetical protein